MNNLKDWAIRYQKMGLSIVPLHGINKSGFCTCRNGKDCTSPGKHPRISWKAYQEIRATEKEVADWWNKWPNANLGIITGRISGVLVLDVDGIKGVDILRDKKFAVPSGVRAQTGNSEAEHFHSFFSHPGFECKNFASKTESTLLPGVDFRGDGGLIVVPPSHHISGGEYTWLSEIGATELKPAPEWLLNLIRAQKGTGSGATKKTSALKAEGWLEDALMGVGEGLRNSTCARLAGLYVDKFSNDLPLVKTILRGWNLRNDPPMPDAELLQTIESIATRQGKKGLSEASGIEIERVIFYESPENNGRYDFYFKIGDKTKICSFLPEMLSSQQKYRQTLLGITNIFLSSMKKEVWEATIQRVLSEAEVRQINSDATDSSWIIGAVRRYLSGSGDDLKNIDTQIIEKDGFIYLTMFFLKKALSDGEEKFTRDRIVTLLEGVGFDSRRSSIGGYKRRCWVIKKDHFDAIINNL